ncbi:MAG: trypsin-like peptidase domain-containing protein, partial [Bacteroidota bacterium]
MRQIKIVLLLSVVLTGCATTESVTRGMHDAATLVVEAPITSVYRLVVETAIESGFLIVSEDPARKEIRLRSGSYMTGMFLCSGHILGVFLSEDRLGRTRVEVSERRVLATQVLGCHDKAPGYMTLLNSKISSVSQRAPTPRTPEIVGGTAFAVRPDGVLLTAFHVVRGAKMIVATCPDGSASPATIEQAAANIDLAVLRIARSTPAFIPLGGTRSSRVGDPVFTVGFPTPALL